MFFKGNKNLSCYAHVSLSAHGDSHMTGIGTKSPTECNRNYLTSFSVFLFNNVENSWKVGSLRSDAKVAQLIYDTWQKRD